MSCIEVRNLFKRYRNKVVINDVSFKVKPGVCGLIGPNGTGKSTILNSLMGLVLPTSGEILIEDQPITKNPHFNQNIGFVPAEPLFPEVKVQDYLKFVGFLRDIPFAEVQKRLEKSSLIKLKKQKCASLSTGQKKILQLFAINLYQNETSAKTILILDEPFNGLDPTKRSLLIKKIQEIGAKGGTVLISTHILSDLQILANQIIMLKPQSGGSKIVYDGPKMKDIEKVYERHFAGGKTAEDLFNI